eukprot:3044664-Pyramimonas_sp.AAC.1
MASAGRHGARDGAPDIRCLELSTVAPPEQTLPPLGPALHPEPLLDGPGALRRPPEAADGQEPRAVAVERRGA